MIYVPDWEPLEVCVRRLIALGMTEEDAKIDLCNSIADKKIDLRILVGGTDDYAGVTCQRSAVYPPIRLAPRDFDWDISRPKEAWFCGGRSFYHEERPIDLLELSTSDLEDVFPGSTAKKPASAPVRISGARVASLFKEWRESRGDDIPTEQEDIDFMKSKGVGRDAVRELRKQYPRLSRGQRKA